MAAVPLARSGRSLAEIFNSNRVVGMSPSKTSNVVAAEPNFSSFILGRERRSRAQEALQLDLMIYLETFPSCFRYLNRILGL
jgi:hypothetical protein